jgi:hypothetical protein
MKTTFVRAAELREIAEHWLRHRGAECQLVRTLAPCEPIYKSQFSSPSLARNNTPVLIALMRSFASSGRRPYFVSTDTLQKFSVAKISVIIAGINT